MELIHSQDTQNTQNKFGRLKKHLVSYIANFLQIRDIMEFFQTCRRIRKDLKDNSHRFKNYHEFGMLLKSSRILVNKNFSDAYKGFFENDNFRGWLKNFTQKEICQIFNKFFSSLEIDLRSGKLQKFDKLFEILTAPNCKYESISVSSLNNREELMMMTKLIQQSKTLIKYNLEYIDIESPEVILFSKAIGNSHYIKELSLSLVNDSSAVTPCENQIKHFLLNIEKNKLISKFHLTGKNSHRFLNFISSHKSIKHLTVSHFHGIYDFLLKNETIEVLEFQENSSSPIHVLYQILQSKTSKIKTLNFNGCTNSVMKNELLLTRVIQFPCVVFSNIEQKNEERLRYFFSLLKDNKNIKKLSLINLKIENSLFEFLLDSLKFNTHIEELDLSQNEITFQIPIQQKVRYFLNDKKNIRKFNIFIKDDPQYRFQNQIDLQLQGKLQ
jgi:hypothetical protein